MDITHQTQTNIFRGLFKHVHKDGGIFRMEKGFDKRVFIQCQVHEHSLYVNTNHSFYRIPEDCDSKPKSRDRGHLPKSYSIIQVNECTSGKGFTVIGFSSICFKTS